VLAESDIAAGQRLYAEGPGDRFAGGQSDDPAAFEVAVGKGREVVPGGGAGDLGRQRDQRAGNDQRAGKLPVDAFRTLRGRVTWEVDV
jgi:hypothetical protein